jgi:hypothetical protein
MYRNADDLQKLLPLLRQVCGGIPPFRQPSILRCITQSCGAQNES